MALSGVTVDNNKIIAALKLHMGIIEDAARSIGCNPSTIYKKSKNEPEIAEAIRVTRDEREQYYIDQNEKLRKKAYETAHKLLEDKCPSMAIFLLKTVGKLVENTPDIHLSVNVIEKPYQTATTILEAHATRIGIDHDPS